MLSKTLQRLAHIARGEQPTSANVRVSFISVATVDIASKRNRNEIHRRGARGSICVAAPQHICE
jgi:hypothetical protein